MADNSKRLSPGDHWRPTADVLNGYQDAADFVQNLKTGGGALPGPNAGRQVAIVTVKNTSGQDCARFDVLGIDTPIFPRVMANDVFTSRVGLLGVIPKYPTTRAGLCRPVGARGKDALPGLRGGHHPSSLEGDFRVAWFTHVVNDDPTRLVSDCVAIQILWKDDDENEARTATAGRW